jgi:hypothetical protein
VRHLLRSLEGSLGVYMAIFDVYEKRSKTIKSDQNLVNSIKFHLAAPIGYVVQTSRQAYRASITLIYSPDDEHSQEDPLMYIQIKATNRTETG